MSGNGSEQNTADPAQTSGAAQSSASAAPRSSGDGPDIVMCESPEPPDAPNPNPKRPRGPLRRPDDARDGDGHPTESPDDAEAANRRLSAGESTGLPAESEPNTPTGADQSRYLNDAAVIRHIDALFDRTIAALRFDDLVEQRVAARGIEELVEQRITAAGIDRLVEGHVAAAGVEKLVADSVAKAQIEQMVEERMKSVGIEQLVEEKVAKSNIEQIVENRVAQATQVNAASIEKLVEEKITQSDIEKLVDEKLTQANIEKLVEGQVTAAGIEQLVDGRVNSAGIEKLVEKRVAAASIDKLVEERVAACGIEGLVEKKVEKGGIDKLVEKQVAASNIEKLVEDRVVQGDIEKLVEQKVAASNIEKIVEGRVSASGIDKLVEERVSASGIEKLVEERVSASGIDKLVEERVSASGIDKLVEERVSASGIDKLVEERISASSIEKLVQERVSASGIDKLVEQQVASRQIERLVEQQVASSNIEKLVEGQVAAKGIDKIVEQQVAASDIEKLVEGRVAASGIDKLVQQSVAAAGLDELVEQRVAQSVESSIREKEIEKLVQDGIAAKGIEALVESSMEAAVKEKLEKQERRASAKIENLTENKMNAVVGRHMGAVEKQVDKLVEQRMEEVVARRMASQDVDAMIVASVATRDVMSGLQAEKKKEEEQQKIQAIVATHVAETGADVEHRLSEALSKQLEEQLASRTMTPVSLSRPPTAPRPFSSSHQARSAAQSKANWSSRSLYTVAAVPNHDASKVLEHSELEANLTEKVLAVQPDRSAIGFNEIVMRDIANSMVRELVGIFESLLDRLLIEKKQDTLRTMVAELVTEDTLKMVATGRDLLLQKEIGHITREIERLGLEVRDRDAAWEERFQITQELRDSQDDLYAWIDERCREIEARLNTLEQNYMTREELEKLFKQQSDNAEQIKQSAARTEELRGKLEVGFLAFQKDCKDTFSTKQQLTETQDILSRQVDSNKEETERSLQELRSRFTLKEELAMLGQEVNARLSALDKAKFDMAQNIEFIDTNMRKTNRRNDEIYATKNEQNEFVNSLRDKMKISAKELQDRIITLEKSRATKTEVLEYFTDLTEKQQSTNMLLGKTTASVDRNTGLLMGLETKVDSNFATRRYVDDTTKSLMEEAVERSDAKEELGRLWKDFETERERLRQTVRQQQATRKDLNDAVEDVQNLRLGTNALEKRCDALHQYTSSIDSREGSHWNNGQETLRQHRQSHQELKELHNALRQELTSQQDYQKAESARLEQRSTYRYLEQIDKALKLTQSVEKVDKEHKDLNETVRNIRLPQV